MKSAFLIAIRYLPLLGVLAPAVVHAQRTPEAPLLTRWAKDIDPQAVHPEYPRPQMKRNAWLNLNGVWDYSVRPWREAPPDKWDGKIVVPFPIESALSGVMKEVGPENRLWYRREFSIPRADEWREKRLLLHFGAVDWEAEVYVNGRKVGTHRGGYDPFSVDVTHAVKSRPDQSDHELVIAVWDPTDAGFQPRGKQVRNPHGIWYTAVTGIWQTVWLEPVPEVYIRSLKITPDLDEGRIHVTADIEGTAEGASVRVRVPSVEIYTAEESAKPEEQQKITLEDVGAGGNATERISIDLPEPKAWSPREPWLYELWVTLHGEDGAMLDTVGSYSGLRKIALGKADDGFVRLFLNNEPVFQYGPLDQGWWPDGLYTAPTDEALRYDIEITKELGFNMIRKHVKVEPARWYHWCDRLGVLVWQDMPSGDRYIGPRDDDVDRVAQSSQQFETELRELIDDFGNHPSIVIWVPFNEGWGQYDTARITVWIQGYDPTRLVISASGWTDRGTGAAHDIHRYPGPGAPEPESDRAGVLGEFGGLGLPVSGHTWQDEENWGYRSYETPEALTEAYVQLLERLRPLIGWKGLAAAVYTQTTDVEIEVNGLLTYDRAVLKMPAERIAKVNRELYGPPPKVAVAVPTSQEEGIVWKYTTTKPSEGWTAADFDDASWQEGQGGFGTRETPGTVVRTEWDGSDIWLRRTVKLSSDAQLEEPFLLIHHDEDAQVYVNGTLAAEVNGHTTGYVLVPLNAEGAEQLRTAAKDGGEVVLAIHCRQTDGGQYIDVGIVDVREGTTEP